MPKTTEGKKEGWELRWKSGDDYWGLHRAAVQPLNDIGEYRDDVLALLSERDQQRASISAQAKTIEAMRAAIQRALWEGDPRWSYKGDDPEHPDWVRECFAALAQPEDK